MHAGVWLYYSNAGSRGLAFSNLLHCSVRAIVDPSLQNIIAKPSITQPEILLAILGGVYTRAGTQRDAAETPGSYWLCYWSIDHFQASLRSASDHPSDMVPAKRPLSHGASSHSSGQVDDPKKARYEGPMESEQPLLDLMYNGFSTADAPAGCTIVAATTQITQACSEGWKRAHEVFRVRICCDMSWCYDICAIVCILRDVEVCTVLLRGARFESTCARVCRATFRRMGTQIFRCRPTKVRHR
jgi:hypothetical protein